MSVRRSVVLEQTTPELLRERGTCAQWPMQGQARDADADPEAGLGEGEAVLGRDLRASGHIADEPLSPGAAGLTLLFPCENG